jgi:hypothetical protein
MRNQINANTLKHELLNAGVLDSGCHSEFAGSKHGLKLHLDRVARGSLLYTKMIRAKAEKIAEVNQAKKRGIVVVGIANGTNQTALDLADYLGGNTIGVETYKIRGRRVKLTQIAKRVIMATQPELVVLDEDVGTEGTVCANLAPQIKVLGAENVIAVHTWQRQPTLPGLDKTKVPYYPVIYDVLPTYTPFQCQEMGYCADGIELIPYSSKES